ncbi:MAG: hypothetical protein IKG89_04445 [Oscillospiraceae bacterium]|nr:hypothetical protein [Oscillospiraceae bacterium]
MSCPYYWYDDHYACRKSGKDVNEDIYYKYCRNYDYDDCPIYKGQDSSGCFLTSACVEAKGLPDDCHELTVLRRFREGYLRSLPEGRDAMAEYYFVAPQIVSEIQKRADSVAVFDSIYEKLVKPCVDMIECGENEGAYRLYRDTVKHLQVEYL